MAYIHGVFFTMKPGTPADRVDAQIADAAVLLATIPTVRRISSGRRDETMQRDVSVTDFDIGLFVEFDDRADHDVYAEHPRHLEYVNRHKAQWARVRVFDYVAD